MAGTPDVLVLHTVDATAWSDPEVLRAEVGARIDADVGVARTPPESRAMVGNAEVILATFFPSSLLEAASNLRWIQALSAGVDFYDLDVLRERGIVLTTASGVHAEPIAEQVLGYMLTFERGIHTGIRQQEEGVWKRYGGGEIRGKTLGIVGLGSIGSRVATYGQAFDMTVIGTKRDPGTAPDAVDEAFGSEGLYEVLGRSDYLVVACPLTEETRGLLGPKELGVLSSDAVLVNVARGGIVDEDALVHNLREGGLRGAALDVFAEEPHPADSPLWDLPNVVMTPHMAGATPHKEERIAGIFATNYEAYTDDDLDSLVNRVD